MMRNISLIVLLILAVFGITYFVSVSRTGSPSSWAERGREITNFEGEAPPAFPEHMPVERKPAQIVKSYAEFIEGDESEGELRHAQYTYVYASTKTGGEIVEEFEKYFKDEGYQMETTSPSEQLPYSVYANKNGEIIGSVTIASRNQIENLVTISLIFIEKTQINAQ